MSRLKSARAVKAEAEVSGACARAAYAAKVRADTIVGVDWKQNAAVDLVRAGAQAQGEGSGWGRASGWASG